MKLQSNDNKIINEFISISTGGSTSTSALMNQQLSNMTLSNQSMLPILKLPGFGVKNQCLNNKTMRLMNY